MARVIDTDGTNTIVSAGADVCEAGASSEWETFGLSTGLPIGDAVGNKGSMVITAYLDGAKQWDMPISFGKQEAAHLAAVNAAIAALGAGAQTFDGNYGGKFNVYSNYATIEGSHATVTGSTSLPACA